eukprot:s1959_g7.t1
MSELGCADGCGRRGRKGVGGKGWGKGAARNERAWMRGPLRTACVQGSGWKWAGRRSRWDECCGWRGCKGRRNPLRAGGVRARERVEMGEEKEPQPGRKGVPLGEEPGWGRASLDARMADGVGARD